LSQGTVQSIGGKLRRVTLGRGQTAKRLVDLIGADSGDVENGRALDHLGDRGGRGPGRAAALGVEADPSNATALDHERDT
jgi:hypothetical protein